MRSICFILTALIISFAACSQKKTAENISPKTTDKAVKESNTGNEEDFYDFLDKFNKDRIFQLKRVMFPVRATLANIADEGMAPMNEMIEKYDWEHLDLTYDSTYLTREFDQYHQDVFFDTDSATIEQRGINNGIHANYYFKLKEGKWYLVGLEETSF